MHVQERRSVEPDFVECFLASSQRTQGESEQTCQVGDNTQPSHLTEGLYTRRVRISITPPVPLAKVRRTPPHQQTSSDPPEWAGQRLFMLWPATTKTMDIQHISVFLNAPPLDSVPSILFQPNPT